MKNVIIFGGGAVFQLMKDGDAALPDSIYSPDSLILNKNVSEETSQQQARQATSKMDNQDMFSNGRISILAKLKLVLPVFLLKMIVPTVDIHSDLIIILSLFFGVYACSSKETFPQFEECQRDPAMYCQSLNITRRNEDCLERTHPYKAIALLCPVLLNYSFCFLVWTEQCFRAKKISVIFPLFNLYPQYGKI